MLPISDPSNGLTIRDFWLDHFLPDPPVITVVEHQRSNPKQFLSGPVIFRARVTTSRPRVGNFRQSHLAMVDSDVRTALVVVLALLAAAVFLTKGKLGGTDEELIVSASPVARDKAMIETKAGVTRNVVEKLNTDNNRAVVFFGSQTGTAEDFAEQISKEASLKYELDILVADLKDYDYDSLAHFPNDNIAIFVLATHGEGEPTDNAVGFYQYLTAQGDLCSRGAELPLRSLRFMAFGLGNKTYKNYNWMVRRVTAMLEKLGAQRVGDLGEGDDAMETTEEDFLSWKEGMWLALAKELAL
ncbi:NADPH-cytochrome P450 reductase [Hypocenomyce scalaris]|nr:NADPH-cytochrome P450 reductase [Hypocenomyce scalaris]